MLLFNHDSRMKPLLIVKYDADYSAGQKKRYKYCFMKQKCQIQIDLAQHKNATTPLNT